MNALLEILNKKFTGRGELAKYLLETLNLSRESVYKRIRGQVDFTYSEVVTLTQRLALPTDLVLNANNHTYDSFHLLNAFELGDRHDINYYFNKILSDYHKLVERIGSANASTISAHNLLPPQMFLQHNYLSRLDAFVWSYKVSQGVMPVKFSDLEYPEKYKKSHLCIGWQHPNQESSIIICRQIFLRLINQINYMRKTDFLSDDDIVHIKKELIELVSELENIAAVGENHLGSKVNLFLSDMDVHGGYLYLKIDNTEIAFIDLYKTQWGVSLNLNVIKMHKQWLESLKKYSTPITNSSEFARRQFFAEQRKNILDML